MPLIAETGGINALIVDSSAQPEQVVRDVLVSSFESAGQRCSSLRVLFLQSDVADELLRLLRGALAELRIGHPCAIATDVPAVINDTAFRDIEEYVARFDAVTLTTSVFMAVREKSMRASSPAAMSTGCVGPQKPGARARTA